MIRQIKIKLINLTQGCSITFWKQFNKTRFADKEIDTVDLRIPLIKIKNEANIYLFKANNKNTRKSCKICSKFTIKTSQRRLSSVFNLNLILFTSKYELGILQNSSHG